MNLAVMALVAAVAAGGNGSAQVGDVRLKGHLGERLDRMIERHVAGTDVDYITACFQEKTERKGWWQTEFWGKWMHSAVPYAAYADSARLRERIERGIDQILVSQEPCGYIGNYPDDLRCGEGWDVWGMKYTMMGLLHYYDHGLQPSLLLSGQVSCGTRGRRACLRTQCGTLCAACQRQGRALPRPDDPGRTPRGAPC